jgi:hypothetical protein
MLLSATFCFELRLQNLVDSRLDEIQFFSITRTCFLSDSRRLQPSPSIEHEMAKIPAMLEACRID